MVKCSIYSSKDEVARVLHSFLIERSYKNILVENDKNTFTAHRRDSVFSQKYVAKFVLQHKSDSVTDIEITVNPHHAVPLADDIKKEEKIRSRIYFYF